MWWSGDFRDNNRHIIDNKQTKPIALLLAHAHRVIIIIFVRSIHSAGREEVLTFGWNEHGICGTGTETNVQFPHIISKSFEDRRIILIGAGAGHSLVLANRLTKWDNQIFMATRYKQLLLNYLMYKFDAVHFLPNLCNLYYSKPFTSLSHVPYVWLCVYCSYR